MRPWQVPAFSKHFTVFTKCVNKENTPRVGEMIQWLKTRFTTKASRKHFQRSPRSTEGILAGEDWHVLSIWGVSPASRFSFPIQRGGVAPSFTAPCHDTVLIASHTTPLACLSPSYYGHKIPDLQNTVIQGAESDLADTHQLHDGSWDGDHITGYCHCSWLPSRTWW